MSANHYYIGRFISHVENQAKSIEAWAPEYQGRFRDLVRLAAESMRHAASLMRIAETLDEARELHAKLALRVDTIEQERKLDIRVGSSNERSQILAYLRKEMNRLRTMASGPGATGIHEDANRLQISIEDIEAGKHLT